MQLTLSYSWFNFIWFYYEFEASESSVFASASWFSCSETSSKDTSPCSFTVSSPAETSTSGLAVSDNSARSSWETCIFSGAFLALLDGNIGVPLFEISPLYKLSKSSPTSSSSSDPSSTCSTCFLSL